MYFDNNIPLQNAVPVYKILLEYCCDPNDSHTRMFKVKEMYNSSLIILFYLYEYKFTTIEVETIKEIAYKRGDIDIYNFFSNVYKINE